MEGGGPDGGSEASYESVASEGGYEPASERGRDPLPRIISSSHCVEIFRRVRWVDAAFCARPNSISKPTGGKGKARAPQTPCAVDTLDGLPPTLMRFDGAMEAWLEEMPASKNECRLVRHYATLNDAANRAGRKDSAILKLGNQRATLWYFTIEFLQQLWPFFLQSDDSGLRLWEKALLDRGCTIQSTHVEVGRVHCPAKTGKARAAWLKALFSAMQGSNWSPDGEARSLLIKRRLTHASMSIGDCLQVGSDLYMVTLTGFVAVKEARALLPQCFDAENEDGDEIGDEDLEWEENGDDDLEDTEQAFAALVNEIEKPDSNAKAVAQPDSKGKAAAQPNSNGKAADQPDSNGKVSKKKKKGKRGGDGDHDGTTEKTGSAQKATAPKGQAGQLDRRAFRAQLQAERVRLQKCN